MVDTSAWIEYFRNGEPRIVSKVDICLEENLIGMGDLIYCEVVQGIRFARERKAVSELLLSLPNFDMVGFDIAEKSAFNYRLLRSKGVTIRKTIDVLIGTFCVENDMQLIHNDVDFTRMAKHIGLKIV